MQVKKEEIRLRILSEAKEEFLEYGFERASLRRIAGRAGMTKGSIYTYFKNKDELFDCIAQPALDFIYTSVNGSYDDEYFKHYCEKTPDSLEESRFSFADFVHRLSEYRDELSILLFSSSGSGKENFREEVFRRYTESSQRFFGRMSELYPNCRVRASEMLIHSLASLYLSMLEEIIVHDPAPDELDEYIEQMSCFVHCGTAGLIEKEK